MNTLELFLRAAMSPQALYIDPSAVTVAVSSISGIVIAVGAVAAIWWTKAKKKAAEKLHIDANAHKEVEDELVIHSEADASAAQDNAPESENSSAEDDSARK